MTNYYWRAKKVRKLKEDINPVDYQAKHPDAIKICKPPCAATMERWSNDGGCKALDGCWVEPDGDCQHGLPSWLKTLHYI